MGNFLRAEYTEATVGSPHWFLTFQGVWSFVALKFRVCRYYQFFGCFREEGKFGACYSVLARSGRDRVDVDFLLILIVHAYKSPYFFKQLVC